MENFRTPYFSKSITEFWRRWHISLSSWLRDYLYINLGGNRKGRILTYRNLMITMLLGGLWHGASWNFIIWGGLHGIYLGFERLINFQKYIESKSNIQKLLSAFISFNFICLAWIFFRAETLVKSVGIITRIFEIDFFMNLKIKDTNIFASIFFNVFIFIILENVIKNISQNKLTSFQNHFYVFVLIILILLFGVNEGSQFIYFQF